MTLSYSQVRCIAALGCCVLLTPVIGCMQKAVWTPPDEPRQAAPPSTPAPRVEYQILYVTATRLNLRACPGMDCPKIATLQRNQEVEKLAESQGWIQVRSRQDGVLGWVDSRYLGTAPVAETQAPPVIVEQPAPVKPVEVKPAEKPVEKSLKEKPAPEKPAAEKPAIKKPEEAKETPPKPKKVAPAEAAETERKEQPAPVKETPAEPEPTPTPPPAPAEPAPKRIRIM